MRRHAVSLRWTSGLIAGLVLVSSLAGMTVTCLARCGPAATASFSAAAADDASLPPCHRRGAAETPAAPAGGGCDGAMACCPTWHHDAEPPRVPAPTVTRLGLEGALDALVPGTAVPAPNAGPVAPPAPDELAPGLAPALASCASRAPPAAA